MAWRHEAGRQRSPDPGADDRRGTPSGYPSPMARSTSIDLTPPVEKAFLVAVDTGDDAGWTAEESLTELANLALTAGAEVVGAEWQNRRHVDPNWYVGKGKAEELGQAKSETGFNLLIADDELSPSQQTALESGLNVTRELGPLSPRLDLVDRSAAQRAVDH